MRGWLIYSLSWPTAANCLAIPALINAKFCMCIHIDRHLGALQGVNKADAAKLYGAKVVRGWLSWKYLSNETASDVAEAVSGERVGGVGSGASLFSISGPPPCPLASPHCAANHPLYSSSFSSRQESEPTALQTASIAPSHTVPIHNITVESIQVQFWFAYLIQR